MLHSLYALSLEELKTWLESHGEKPFRAGQIFNWLYERGVSSWDQMTNLSQSLKNLLNSHFTLDGLLLLKQEVSQDQETIKFLFELSDGRRIESVLILSDARRTVCVSSQVGCPARCAFCASGKQGLMRNLTAAEIFEQVAQIDRVLKAKEERVSHVVFMGMGEPFENYDAVVKTIRMLNDPIRLQISQRRMTVSTVGVVEGIRKFTEEGLQVNLVLSLHAPTQDLRKKIIPYARKYPLEEIMSAMLDFSRRTKRDITYEYTLLQGINDRICDAEELSRLVKKQPCTVNLIPYNPVEGLRLQRPKKESIENFREILEKAGIEVTWRYTKGKDIQAACGQLALQECKSPTRGSDSKKIEQDSIR